MWNERSSPLKFLVNPELSRDNMRFCAIYNLAIDNWSPYCVRTANFALWAPSVLYPVCAKTQMASSNCAKMNLASKENVCEKDNNSNNDFYQIVQTNYRILTQLSKLKNDRLTSSLSMFWVCSVDWLSTYCTSAWGMGAGSTLLTARWFKKLKQRKKHNLLTEFMVFPQKKYISLNSFFMLPGSSERRRKDFKWTGEELKALNFI